SEIDDANQQHHQNRHREGKLHKLRSLCFPPKGSPLPTVTHSMCIPVRHGLISHYCCSWRIWTCVAIVRVDAFRAPDTNESGWDSEFLQWPGRTLGTGTEVPTIKFLSRFKNMISEPKN